MLQFRLLWFCMCVLRWAAVLHSQLLVSTSSLGGCPMIQSVLEMPLLRIRLQHCSLQMLLMFELHQDVINSSHISQWAEEIRERTQFLSDKLTAAMWFIKIRLRIIGKWVNTIGNTWGVYKILGTICWVVSTKLIGLEKQKMSEWFGLEETVNII